MKDLFEFTCDFIDRKLEEACSCGRLEPITKKHTCKCGGKKKAKKMVKECGKSCCESYLRESKASDENVFNAAEKAYYAAKDLYDALHQLANADEDKFGKYYEFANKKISPLLDEFPKIIRAAKNATEDDDEEDGEYKKGWDSEESTFKDSEKDEDEDDDEEVEESFDPEIEKFEDDKVCYLCTIARNVEDAEEEQIVLKAEKGLDGIKYCKKQLEYHGYFLLDWEILDPDDPRCEECANCN